MKHVRHDLNYLTSASLLLALIVAAITGIIAHLWDLNDFVYHTYAGYVMTALAAAHVALNWRRMINYFRMRLRHLRRRRAASARTVAAPQPTTAEPSSPWVSRRAFLSLIIGALGGWFAGRGLRAAPAIEGGNDLGVVYHQWSKPGVIDALGTVANWGQQPPLYKHYPGAPRFLLDRAAKQSGPGATETIWRRRSDRDFAGTPLRREQLGALLELTGGISGERWGNQLRTAPSSGALYPIEIYPVVFNVRDLPAGVYHYAVQEHALEQLQGADLRSTVVRAGLMQEFLGQASVVLFLTVIFQRMRWKYQDRTYRYGLIEAGHLGQNCYLAATAMGLGACAVGAFLDDDINAMLGVDGTEEAAIYMLAVGTTKRG